MPRLLTLTGESTASLGGAKLLSGIADLSGKQTEPGCGLHMAYTQPDPSILGCEPQQAQTPPDRMSGIPGTDLLSPRWVSSPDSFWSDLPAP